MGVTPLDDAGLRGRWKGAAVGFLLASGLGACAATPFQVAQREDYLAASGFWARPADTPARLRMMNSLPPHQFIERVGADATSYVYADPLVCGCLYVGSQRAYDLYTSNMRAKNKADEHAMLAQMYANPGWNWREWAPTDPAYGPSLGW